MAYDTKAMFSLIANNIAKSASLEEAYAAVLEAANAEGVSLPTYEEKIAEIKAIREKYGKK